MNEFKMKIGIFIVFYSPYFNTTFSRKAMHVWLYKIPIYIHSTRPLFDSLRLFRHLCPHRFRWASTHGQYTTGNSLFDSDHMMYTLIGKRDVNGHYLVIRVVARG